MSSPGSVTFCITELDLGGAEKALVRLAGGLKNAGWNVNVVSLRDAGVMSIPLEERGIPIQALNCGSLADPRTVPRLASILRAQQPDFLVCFLHQANIVGRLAGRLAGVPHVVSGVRVADRRKWITWIDGLTQSLSSHYFAVSQEVAAVHGQRCGIAPEKMSVLYNGVDIPDHVPERKSGDENTFRLLFVGRLTKQKRPLDLVHAVEQLPDELRKRVRVDYLGDGELRSFLQKAINSAGLHDQIHIHGHRPDVDSWMARADVLVLPSSWEGLPNVVLEAMAVRLPVVAAAVDGVLEILNHDATGLLYKSGNISELAAALSLADSTPESLTVMADRALEVVRQRFRWQTSIDQLADTLLELRANASDS